MSAGAGAVAGAAAGAAADAHGTTGTTRVTAHRGDSSAHRENTLEAVQAALDAGVPTIEVDVRLTRDGEVVVLHDETAGRLWGDPRAVAAMSAADVRALGGPGLRVPTLAEVLALVDGTGSVLLVDLADPRPAVAAAAVVARHPGPARVAWCGDHDALRAVRAADPDAVLWQPWSRADPPTAADLVELGPAVVNLPHLLVGPRLVAALHELGVLVACWTVDDVVQARRLAAVGVDLVTTNRPGEVAAALADDRPLDADEERARQRTVARALAAWAVDHVRRHPVEHVEAKADAADLVTEVDREIELGVRAVVAAQFPDHAFVGEELGGDGRADVPCWYLDPVDGTANLAAGVPWTSFSLALVVDGEPVVGVVADPWRDVVVDAVAGGGAWSGGRRLRLGDGAGPGSGPRASSDEPRLGDPLRGRVVSTELAGHRPWPGMLELLDGLAARFCTLRIMGSGTLTVAGIALGHGVGAVVGTFGPVDHLAACLIVRESGGVVLDEAGRDALFPASGGVLAARDRGTAVALHALWTAARREHARS